MKTIEEIYQEMLELFRRETGMEASGISDLAVRFYAVAAQVYGLYVQEEWLGRQCFPQTAEGEYLDRHAVLRGLERRGALRAEGTLRFSVDAPAASELIIPVGTVCTTAALIRFETVERAVLKAGEQEVDVAARAVEPGEAGNVPAGSILAMTLPPVGVSRCINPQPFQGGLEQEGDESLRKRVLETYRRMPNGANAAFYEQGALSFEQVVAATVFPRSRGKGTVDVVIATAAGLPEDALLQKVEEYFQSRREIAVDVQVKKPVIKPVKVKVKVIKESNARAEQVKAETEQVLRQHFTGVRLSQGVLLAELYQMVFSLSGVSNCTIVTPVADIKAVGGELPQLETLTVEVV